MNEIPCQTCATPNTCRKDRHCNRPRTLEHASRELSEATAALQAAMRRASEALNQAAAILAAQTGN